MKKILPLFILFSLTFSAYAQSLIGENKQWYERESFITQAPITDILKLEGDTLVDNKLYKKIFRTRDTANQVWTLNSRLIREDSTKKVWLRYLVQNEPQELLLYDFDLVVGDSFFINDSFQPCKIPVTNVDSILLTNGEMRKRITFSYQRFGGDLDETYWIEGIGSHFGLLRHLGAYCQASDYARSLRCYFEDGERLFGQVPEANCFYLFTNTEDLEEKIKFSVYPNPVSEQLTLTLPDNQNRSWELFNYQGQRVRNGEVNNNGDQISVKSLSSGIYFLKIENLGIQKLMVQ